MFARKISWAVAVVALAGVALPWTFGKDEMPAEKIAVPVKQKPVVQLAILLDTSGSMSGLIDQAKGQLWKIVNEFAKAKQNGQSPELQVALYQYGTPSLGADNGYVRQIVGLSTDLDKISEELFKLRTDGGDEYCGTVIKHAMENLKWTEGKNVYKAVFIAGNEPFSQGNVDFRKSCKEAIGKGIMVNTIYCGAANNSEAKEWAEGATLADGAYMSIDQNQQVVHITAPQDKQIAELGEKLNKTYVAYGAKGRESAVRQQAMDQAATTQAAAGSNVQRSVAKANAQYKNAEWDLVDAKKDGTVNLKEMKAEELPEEMRNLKPEEREKYVAEKQKEREAIQADINKLNKEREVYVAAEQKKQAEASGKETLDSAMLKVIRTQAEKAELKFEETK